MSLIPVVLTKLYEDGETLFESDLDAWRLGTQSAFNTLFLNLTQLRKDLFLSTYDYNNNGNPSISQSLQEQINLLASGGTPITGTTADSFTINTDGFGVTLSSAGMGATRLFTFPNVAGQIANNGTDGMLIPTTTPTTGAGSAGLDNATGNIFTIIQNSVATRYETADIKQHYFEKDDFLGFPVAGGTYQGPLGMTAQVTNSGTIDNLLVDNTHIGVVQFNTNANASATATIVGQNGVGAIMFGGGQWSFEAIIRIPTLSTGGERFGVVIGLGSNTAALDLIAGCYFKYIDSLNSGQWQLVAASNSTRTTTNSASAPLANTWYKLKIVVNAAGNLATFFVNGSSIGTVATNIPTTTAATLGCAPLCTIVKSIGTTSRQLQIDCLSVEYVPTVVR